MRQSTLLANHIRGLLLEYGIAVARGATALHRASPSCLSPKSVNIGSVASIQFPQDRRTNYVVVISQRCTVTLRKSRSSFDDCLVEREEFEFPVSLIWRFEVGGKEKQTELYSSTFCVCAARNANGIDRNSTAPGRHWRRRAGRTGTAGRVPPKDR